MSNNRSAWISRRGQAGAAAAIDQVIERQPQPGEQVQQVPDEWIEDSPYQTRQAFSDASLEDLAQGMRAAGFQGVLIVRPHADPVKRRGGVMQLVYGHRRRSAWRQVCAERGEPCLLPVVVREIGDEQMLLIGAQENLQRQDLDPIEEAQIVAWHERLFFKKNQAEIGALLGKSEDWVKTRARIHKLPEPLKDRLRQRPRAISQILELAGLYTRQPKAALALADEVVQEQLTLDAVRVAVRNYVRPTPAANDNRDKKNNQRGAAPIVTDDTNKHSQPVAPGDDMLVTQTRTSQTGELPTRTEAPIMAGAHRLPLPEPGQETDLHPWVPRLCQRMAETTAALRKVRGETAVLDDESATILAKTIEELLCELDLLTRALGQHKGT